jgi:methionyl-tRNA synthetase
LTDAVDKALADLDPRRATQLLLEAVAAVNRDLEASAPWKLAKDPRHAATLDQALVRQLNSATEIVRALGPILPDLARRLEAQLAPPGCQLAPAAVAYPRLVGKSRS